MEVTRSGYWVVRQGDALVSRHVTLEEAFQSASRHLPCVVLPPAYFVEQDAAQAPAPLPDDAYGLPFIRLAAGI